jgi:tetratricopeptide (TPR) repeat protein
MRVAKTASVLCSILLAGSIANAQTPPPAGPQGRGGQPPPMTNLQIFPKDTPRPQVVQTMQLFAQALGVRCGYCHVDEGPGKQDFASDEKASKKAARQMMLLAREINEKLPAAVGKSADATTRVGCVTCHRGVAIPKQLAEIVTQTATEKGLAAAMDQYRDLRKRYYGGQSYDFSENGLIAVAQRSSNDTPDEALKWLELNTEFYPKSSRTYVVMSQIYGRKNERDNQIKNLEKAVDLDPQNQQAARMLEQLKKP